MSRTRVTVVGAGGFVGAAFCRHLAQAPGIELVAVSVDSGWEEVRRFFPEGIPPEVVKARERDAHLRYGSRTLPDSYIVSADGRLVERLTGARDWSTPAAQRYLRALGSRYR